MSKRLLQTTICLFGIINFYVYNGGLISSLMVQKYENAEEDELTDFLDKPEYKLLIDNNIAVESYLSTSSDPKCKILWAIVKSQNGFTILINTDLILLLLFIVMLSAYNPET